MATTEVVPPMPTIEEERHADDLLQHALETVEDLAWQIERVTDFPGGQGPADVPPFPITLEAIGVVACLIADLDSRIDDFMKLRDSLRKSVFALQALRLEQLGQGENGSAKGGAS